MAKRKEYLEVAEQSVRALFKAYYNDSGVIPGNNSLFKGALTRAFNKVYCELHDEAAKRIGLDPDNKNYWKQRQALSEEIIEEVKNILKEK